MRYLKNKEGFTLIELMIVTALAGIIMAGFYTALISQQKSYTDQDQVNLLQQNLRTAVSVMKHEIRMAGYDPTHSSGAAFITAGASCCRFTMDITGNGDVDDSNEDISFGFSASVDINGNGIADRDFFDQSALDAGASLLGRNTGGGFQPMADGIYAVGFAYAFDDAADGDNDPESIGGNIIWAVDTNPVPDGILDTDINGNALGGLGNDDDGDPVAPIGIASIRAVKIWLLAVALRPDPAFAHAAGRAYRVGNKVIVPAPNDRRRMRLITTTVLCRNM